MNDDKISQHITGSNNIFAGIGDVIIHKPSVPDATALLQQGIQLIGVDAYEHASEILNEAIKADPLMPEVYYYLALSLLKGQRPRLLTHSTIKEIEKWLQIAINLNSVNSHCFALWAIVKEDYYVLNGMYATPPNVSELWEHVSSVEAIHINEMVTCIQAPDNRVWEWLNSVC